MKRTKQGGPKGRPLTEAEINELHATINRVMNPPAPTELSGPDLFRFQIMFAERRAFGDRAIKK